MITSHYVRLWFNSRPGPKFGSRFLCSLANSAMMSTLTVVQYTVSGKMRRCGRGLATCPDGCTVHCQWEDETVWERTGHLPSYVETKKIKSLSLHTHGSPTASLMDCSSRTRAVH